ncbi:MAG: hypothetical protein NT076_01200 [Candidatus Pacearchaeota archaeon]|nr:hypothetical protein [Candidatus Pacearchaeota archaeon]
MKLEITTKRGSKLTSREINLMNKERIKEYGKNNKNFRREPESIFFFVKDAGKIVSFGMLKPVSIYLDGKNYDILGIGNILSIVRRREYARILIAVIISYLKKENKTGLGFCENKISGFYEKVGLNVKKNMARRFRYRYATKAEEKRELGEGGCGIYYESKDKFIKNILSTKSLVHLEVPFW